MARLYTTSRFATALLLAALPGWTIGAGELFQAFANAANTDAASSLGNAFAQAVGSNAGSLLNQGTNAAGAALATNALGVTPEQLGMDALNNPNPTAGIATGIGALAGNGGTSLGQGLSWNFGSKGMIDMLTGFFMTFLSGTPDPNSALNIYGNALMSQDPVQISAAFGKLLTSMDLTCAFQMTAGGDGVDMKFRDGKEALHIQFVPTTSATVFNFKGRFPRARAFSYATYSVVGQTVQYVDMVSDIDIVADTGANPFAQGPATIPATGTYDLYVTPDGKQGFANEIKAYPDGKSSSEVSGLIIVYRIIMADGIAANGWGNVPPPQLRIKAFNLLATGLWINMAQCNENNDKVIQQFLDDKLTLQEGVSDVRVECDVFNMDNNFVYYDDAQYFKTPDENHLISCANKALAPAGSDLIVMISGTIPPASESRYASLNLVNLYPPGKNVYSVSDQALRNFYWQQGKSAVNYTIIMARNKLALSKCGLAQLPSNWFQVYWSGFQDANEGSYPGIVYREVMTNGYEQSLEQVRYACAEQKECSNPKFFQEQMGAYYPRISYLTCNQDGTIKPAPVGNPNMTFPDPILPTPAPQGIWTSLAARDALGISCEPKVTVSVAALQGSDVYIDGKLAGRATDNPKVVSKQAAAFGWSPIQAVYYDPEAPATASPVVKSYIDNGAEVQLELVPTPANFMPEEVVVALRVPITEGGKAFFATHDVCGSARSSAAGWKCKVANFKDTNWTMPGFDDTDWLPAKALKKLDACTSIGTDCNALPADAQGIWADTCTASNGPNQGYVYCRIVTPQQCDLSCVAGSDDRVKTWCPDRKNALATARFASPTLHWLYANGQEIGGDQTMVNPAGTTSFPLDTTAATITLAFKAVDDTRKVVKSFIKGQFNLCGYQWVTDGTWKCAPSEPFTNDWTKPGFDDSAWTSIQVVDGYPWQPNPSAGMSPDASWVWSPKGTQAWCRLEVPNPVYEPLQSVVIG